MEDLTHSGGFSISFLPPLFAHFLQVERDGITANSGIESCDKKFNVVFVGVAVVFAF